jgi:hypothetical protein
MSALFMGPDRKKPNENEITLSDTDAFTLLVSLTYAHSSIFNAGLAERQAPPCGRLQVRSCGEKSREEDLEFQRHILFPGLLHNEDIVDVPHGSSHSSSETYRSFGRN